MDILQARQSYRARIDKSLEQYIGAMPDLEPRLKQAMEYALTAGGKRVRPFLAYACAELFDVELTYLDGPAAAIECIHAYSLVHDDLPAMDDDDLRRGQPTCHIAFDEATAILAGDALHTMAFEILTECPLPENCDRVALIATLAHASGYQGMCGGQALDIAGTDQEISLEQLETIHRHKTGALIRASIRIGAIVGNASQAELETLDNYASAIGLAFQVQDDILDVTSDTATLGKPQGSDQALNKATYPALLGLDGAQARLRDLHFEAFQSLDQLQYNAELLRLFASYIVNRKS